MIYAPEEDSLLLEKWVRQLAFGKVLDMGCGSGILARAALSVTDNVLACDINPEAVALCSAQGISAVVSDLFSTITGTFDVIIFNPPYLPFDPAEDAESALITTGGTQGMELLERFLSAARLHLNSGGKILFVCSTLTGNVEELLTHLHYHFLLLDSQSHFFEVLKVYAAWL
jgi:release factor glutamine methyltransferase